MAKCRGAFTAAKFCLFSVILVITGLLAGSALSGGKDSFFAAFLQTAAEPAAANEKRITIVIDAGHGGMDGGAVSDTGVLEKDLNLAVASKLCELFRLADVDVVMTRSDDRMLCSEGSNHKKRDDLARRVEIAESYENAMEHYSPAGLFAHGIKKISGELPIDRILLAAVRILKRKLK